MKKCAGFSLVELLVSLIIGLLLSLALGSMAMNYGSSRQNSISANTVDMNVAMADQVLSSSLQMAGNGLVSGQNQTCTKLYSSSLNGVAFNPVTIDTSNANSDRLSFAYGTGNAAVSMLMASAGVSDVTAGSAVSIPTNAYNASVNAGTSRTDADILVGDDVLYAYGLTLGACTLLNVASTSVASGYETIKTSTFSLQNAPNFNTNFYVVPLKKFIYKTFYAENGMLKLKDNLTGNVSIISDGVIYLRAQYGVTLGTDSLVWTDSLPSTLSSLKAVRLSLILRSSAPEKQASSANCTSTTNSVISFSDWTDISDGSTSVDISTLKNSSSSALIPDWQCYFYKSSTVVIPLRSLIWGLSS